MFIPGFKLRNYEHYYEYNNCNKNEKNYYQLLSPSSVSFDYSYYCGIGQPVPIVSYFKKITQAIAYRTRNE